MKVAIVTGGLPLGGSTTFILFLAGGLKSIGVEVQIFSFTSANPFAAEFSSAGIRVYACNERRDIYEDRLQQIYGAMRLFQPSVVMSVLGVESFEMLRYLPAGVLRIGVILDLSIRPHLFVPRYASTMDHIVVIAEYLVTEVRRARHSPPATYLRLGIPIPNDIPPKDLNRSAPLRLIYYGRLEDDSKGVSMFPKITAALKKRKVRYQWTIHGTGPREDYLRRALAAEVEEGSVRFSSPVSAELLPSIIRAHDIYILTSTNEGGPLTLLESMALGLVPVCGDIPALVQEVITADNGFRVPRDNADAYAERIAQLDADRELLQRLSAAARATITTEYSHEAMAQRYAELFRSLQKPDLSREWPEKISTVGVSGTAPIFSSRLGRSLRRLGKQIQRRS